METRANHILVGAFVMLMLAGIVVFIVWAAKIGPQREYDYYTIYFEHAVTGLSRTGEVRFNGIYVGSVRDIKLDPKKPGQVKVNIQVLAGTPINTHSVASLEVPAFTGVSYVQILEDDDEDKEGISELLPIIEGENYPVIPSQITGLQGLVLTAPELLERGIALLDQANKLFGDENIALVHNILADVEDVTDTIAAQKEDLRRAIILVRSTIERIDRVAETAETIAKDDMPLLIEDIRLAAGNFRKLSENLDATISENRDAVAAFTATALPEISQFVTEARRLAASLTRIAERIESDPAEFIFPPNKPQIEAPE